MTRSGSILAAAVLAWTAASHLGAAPSPTASPSFSASPTQLPLTATATVTLTDSPTFTATPSASPTATPALSITDSPTPSVTHSPSASVSASPTPSSTATPSPSPAFSATPSPAVTATPVASTGGLEDPRGETYAYPNPARDGVVNIVFRIDGPGEARLRVFQSAAEPAAELTEHYASAGVKSLAVPLDGFARGLYIYKVDFKYDDGHRDKRPLGKFVRSAR